MKNKKYYEEQIKYYEEKEYFNEPDLNWNSITFEEKCRIIDSYEYWEEEQATYQEEQRREQENEGD